jgi:hypothetical protein
MIPDGTRARCTSGSLSGAVAVDSVLRELASAASLSLRGPPRYCSSNRRSSFHARSAHWGSSARTRSGSFAVGAIACAVALINQRSARLASRDSSRASAVVPSQRASRARSKAPARSPARRRDRTSTFSMRARSREAGRERAAGDPREPAPLVELAHVLERLVQLHQRSNPH